MQMQRVGDEVRRNAATEDDASNVTRLFQTIVSSFSSCPSTCARSEGTQIERNSARRPTGNIQSSARNQSTKPVNLKNQTCRADAASRRACGGQKGSRK